MENKFGKKRRKGIVSFGTLPLWMMFGYQTLSKLMLPNPLLPFLICAFLEFHRNEYK
jgi:hypothetical protein